MTKWAFGHMWSLQYGNDDVNEVVNDFDKCIKMIFLVSVKFCLFSCTV